MPFYVIDSTNSIHNVDNTPLGGVGLALGSGDSGVVMANGSVIASGAAGTGIYVNAYATNANLVVNGFVYGTSTGIYSLGQYAQIAINGQVFADYTAVRVQNDGYVYVSPTGVVSGSEGLSLASSTLVNDGSVNGIGNDAIQLSSGWLINNGLISSRGFGAIFYGGDGAGNITNTGTMQGDLTTYYNASAATARLTITNSGNWFGRLGLSPGDDTVVNTGTITGDITLGNGNNSLDSRYGFVGGNVTSGSGNDTILLGAGDTIISGGGGADRIDGGAGFDIVSYSSSAHGVSVDLLNGTAARGDARGNHLSNIEGLYGSQFNDTLTGDNGDNLLNGVLGGDTINGNGGNDTIVMLGGGGRTTINGGAGNDLIQLLSLASGTYGYAFRTAVQVNGGSGYDTLEISDAPSMTFTDTTVRNIERLMVDDGFSYNFTSADANVASGARMWVDGSSLTGSNTIRFIGSAETNGAFDFSGGEARDRFVGGAGNDTFDGGGLVDTMTGGAGSDLFIYTDVTDSTFGSRDVITDFNTAADTFQFGFDVTGVDAPVSGSVTTGGDLSALASGHLGAGHAMLVNVTGGTLAGHTLLVVDANGIDGFQKDFDFCIDVTGMSGALTVSDFIVG